MDAPKTKGKQYTPFALILDREKLVLNKCVVEIRNNKLFVEDREVGSFIIEKKKSVFIQADHYRSRRASSSIRSLRAFLPGESDDYTYFLEEGFSKLSKEDLQHLSGATTAEVRFNVKFRVLVERLWIKVEKQHPVKFAIEGGLDSDDIIEITVERL